MTRRLLKLLTLALLVPALACAADNPTEKPADKAKGTPVTSGPLQFKLKGIDGKEVDLAQYKGKVVLFVNVASKCGYTPQYKALQELYEKYKEEGLVVVGVPANDFGKQEPGSDAEIAKFCEANYKVTFPMAAKVAVTGENISPLYQFLTDKATNPKCPGEVAWNFEKFLVGRDGEVVARYKSGVDPLSDTLMGEVKKQLAVGK